MKAYYDRQAKFREMAVGDTVLADDHLSSQKWQSGTVLGHKFPHSYQVQLDDGRIWKRHVDDVLQKKHLALKLQPPEQHLQNLLKPMLMSVIYTFSLPPQLNPSHADSEQKEASPSASLELRQSRRTQKPPHRH